MSSPKLLWLLQIVVLHMCILVSFSICTARADGVQYPGFFAEGYPPDVAEQVEVGKREEQKLADSIGTQGLNYIINRHRWNPGYVLTVAFNGGDQKLYSKIASAASGWNEVHANIRIDFGRDPVTGLYRTWSEDDAEYSADVRVGFGPAKTGYWSAVGTDSVVKRFYPPNKRSMNFEGFNDRLPPGWEGTVLHEFGHALGFVHEHQHPACHDEIRWDVGPHGEPSVFDVFKQWQGWDRKETETNLHTFDPTEGDLLSAQPKKDSIMFYAMPADCFVKGRRSMCFKDGQTTSLSSSDKEGLRLAYFFYDVTARQRSIAQQEIAQTATVSLPENSPERRLLESHIEAIKQQAKPRVFIHIGSEDQRPLAQKIQKSATENGFVAPGVQNVAGKGFVPDTLEVRYRIDPEDRPSADFLLKLLQTEFSIANARVSYTEAGPRPQKSEQIELWFPSKVKLNAQ